MGNLFLEKALEISSSFEGKKALDWANPVPNFDGAILTCGVIGFTWKYSNQIPLIRAFLERFGAAKGKILMPTYWDQYLKAVKLGEIKGGDILKTWTYKVGQKYLLIDSYKKELTDFWSSKEMIQIQKEEINNSIGIFADKKSQEVKEFLNLSELKLGNYCFFFDLAVNNGTSKKIDLIEANHVSLDAVIEYCRTETGATQVDLRKNYELWKKQLFKLNAEKNRDQILLLKYAFLRAKLSSSLYDTVTMNRKGTLALGIGYVNGELRKYEWCENG